MTRRREVNPHDWRAGYGAALIVVGILDAWLGPYPVEAIVCGVFFVLWGIGGAVVEKVRDA